MAKLLNKNYNKQFSILAVLTLLMSLFYYQTTSAATLTSLSDTMTRLKTGVASDHTIKFTTPTGIASTNTVTLTFPASSFTMGASLTGVTIANGAGADNAVTSASYLTNVLTITASATSVVTAGNVATIKIPTAQITNPAAATYVITIGGTFGDTGKIAVVIVSDEQVQLSANVDPSITFSLSANSSAFGTLSTGSIVQGATDITATVGTNAASGYTVTVRDAGSGTNPGLFNSNASYLIGSADAAYANGPTTLAPGTEGYGICVASTTGSPTIAARFGSSGADCTTSKIVGGLEVTDTTFISRSSQMSSNDTAVIRHWAAISSWTKAGNYTDTLTYVVAGNF